ncbi:MAG: hypothetical protein DI603_02590 [Roseateles depolymerans]|uniref:protein O-GlcNAc transferase n=1 Tax=Roseateles depolymerans TaxID=76731 RepID=A0A2W5DYD5_9BURK|nr:MAG: hypothetical protein DI603_02590 [Roseateles depolymerans]
MASHQSAASRAHREAGEKLAEKAQWARAEQEFQQASRLAPKDGLVWLQLARVQWLAGRGEAAAQSARRSVELLPDNPLAYRVLDGMLKQLGQHQTAVEVLERVASDHQSEELLLMRAGSLFALGRHQEVVTTCLQVLGRNPKNPLGHYHLGRALKALKMDDQSAISFETAVLTDQTPEGGVRHLALPMLVLQLAAAADWGKLKQYWSQLLDVVEHGDVNAVASIAPFTLLAQASTPEQQLRVGRLHTQARSRDLPALPPVDERRPGRLRIGWLSSDFHRHATVVLLTELLELLDRERFEIFLYCHSVEDGSEAQRRIRAAGDHFRDVRRLSDPEVAQLMRADGIDIAVDLKGHTEGSRMQILAARPAPVQLSYLGYPGSTGADFLDYVVGDPIVTPLGHAPHYSERIAQLPQSYQPNDSRRAVPPRHARAEHGLPDDAVVLCCFNQTYKISEAQVDLWARVMREASRPTVLWLLNWSPSASRHLTAAFQARGVDAARLYFSPLVSPEDNLARLQCADLFLDTYPCNAHTTASEALWAGVPVLTVAGESFASRVAASLLNACGLSRFVCVDPQSYVQRAIALIDQPGELASAQQHLRERRHVLPLFDSRRYARDFEALLERIWARQDAGLPPDHLAAAQTEVLTGAVA